MGFFDSFGSTAAGLASGVGGAASTLMQPGMIQDMATGGAYSNAKAVADTNRMQMELADKQMAFQERMSNSAYQRGMEDMRKAGLNPMLAFSQGGASAPSGAMAQLTAPRPGDIGAGLMHSASALATGIPAIKNTQASTESMKAQAETQVDMQAKLRANAIEANSNSALTRAQEQTEYERMQTAREEKKQKKMETRLMEKAQKSREQMAPIKGYVEAVGQAAGAANSAKSVLSPRLSPYESRAAKDKADYWRKKNESMGDPVP